jgi:hypothetical protein
MAANTTMVGTIISGPGAVSMAVGGILEETKVITVVLLEVELPIFELVVLH